jgi:hypothetical protein
MGKDGNQMRGILQGGISFGFSSVSDWFDSIILSFPAPWIIGESTHYGTEIFDARGTKVLSVWMAWGSPSDRQRGSMSDAEWIEYCCDSHWESETQWHIANAIVTTRNYLQVHKDRGFYSDSDNEQFNILRNLVMSYSRWEAVDAEIACGGPERRMTSTEAEKVHPHLTRGRTSQACIDAMETRERLAMLQKLKERRPDVGLNPEAVESKNRSRAMMSAMWRMLDEVSPKRVILDSGLEIDSMTIMDKLHLDRLVQIAEEEYDNLKRDQRPGNT